MQLSRFMPSRLKEASAAIAGALLITAGLPVGDRAIAQNSACQAPRANEYLLLVRNPQSDTQSKLRQLLPSNAVLTPCSYVNENVVRVEGFASADVASAWAKYLSDQAGLQAIVSSPGGSTTAANPPATTPPSNSGSGSFPRPNTTPTTPTTPTTTGSGFNPQPLGAGYAVLVSYFNRPEVAADVRKVTNRNVGLVSFEQRPYLLAAYATDSNAANAVLSKLTENGFVAVLVDSRGAVLLTANVR
jgi:hypothetical protein